MSSRIIGPDDTRTVGQVCWRQVNKQGGAVQGPAAGTPDFATQIAQLQQQYEQRVKEAHAAGLREGEALGRSRAMAETQPVIDRLCRSIDELAQFRGRMRREAEADTIKLALAIAKRILRRDLAVDPEALHGLVLGALERLQSQEISRVRVHPAHAAAVAAQLKNTVSGTTIEVIADSGREPGAVLFETKRGNLDASVESQLQEIERGLADCLRRQP
jgi:flagellar assembly protein FliH